MYRINTSIHTKCKKHLVRIKCIQDHSNLVNFALLTAFAKMPRSLNLARLYYDYKYFNILILIAIVNIYWFYNSSEEIDVKQVATDDWRPNPPPARYLNPSKGAKLVRYEDSTIYRLGLHARMPRCAQNRGAADRMPKGPIATSRMIKPSSKTRHSETTIEFATTVMTQPIKPQWGPGAKSRRRPTLLFPPTVSTRLLRKKQKTQTTTEASTLVSKHPMIINPQDTTKTIPKCTVGQHVTTETHVCYDVLTTESPDDRARSLRIYRYIIYGIQFSLMIIPVAVGLMFTCFDCDRPRPINTEREDVFAMEI